MFGLDLDELCLDEIKLCYESKLLESAELLITFVLVLIVTFSLPILSKTSVITRYTVFLELPPTHVYCKKSCFLLIVYSPLLNLTGVQINRR